MFTHRPVPPAPAAKPDRDPGQYSEPGDDQPVVRLPLQERVARDEDRGCAHQRLEAEHEGRDQRLRVFRVCQLAAKPLCQASRELCVARIAHGAPLGVGALDLPAALARQALPILVESDAEKWSRPARGHSGKHGQIMALHVATLACVTTLDLRSLRVRSGEQFRDERRIELEPFELGGQRYLPVPQTVPAELTITRASTGTVFELRFHARLHGPCFRCLDDAVLDVDVAAREYQAESPGGDEELQTAYLQDDKLDLSGWARDAVALELPDKILCRPDCAGLCPVCGKNLNDEPHDHGEPEPDSRWAALAELKEKL
jgi:uncharacterized protein